MKIAISGGSGYIGRNLINKLRPDNMEWVHLSRNSLYDVAALKNLLNGCNAVINLAGEPILQRWSAENKKRIYSSRVITTSNIVSAISQLPENGRPKIFISASAVGIYKINELHDENSISFANNFLGQTVQDWEKASVKIPADVRRVIFRMGIVLGKDSKTITNMRPFFQIGLGAIIGNGHQVFPFVHIDDVIAAFQWALLDAKVEGIFNLVAPDKKTNKELSETLGKKLNRPVFLHIPSSILKIIYGEAASVLIESPVVESKRLGVQHFIFSRPTLQESISDL